MVDDKKKNRSFKVKLSSEGKAVGRYTGDSPYQAANKALSEIVRKREKGKQAVTGKINFGLIESTKNSSHREHLYVGKRIKLKKPIKYQIGGGTEIIKKFKNELRKVKKCDSANFKFCGDE